MSTPTMAMPLELTRPPLGTLAPPAARRRLALLICAIVLMGLTDLLCTLSYLTSVGLIEVNPIARWVINNLGMSGLIAFKAASMLFTCGALFIIRQHRAGEKCAWICATVLLLLMLHWVRFNEAIPNMSQEMILLALNEHAFPIDSWVTLAQH